MLQYSHVPRYSMRQWGGTDLIISVAQGGHAP